MFGDNPTRPREHDPALGISLQGEPFYTIQGEGPFAGMPALFMRLWGCHLACWFCDTDFESNRRVYNVSELVSLASGSPAPLVVLTGGEPMRQDITDLCRELLYFGKIVQIETTGSFMLDTPAWREVLSHPKFNVVVSPKTPAINKDLEPFIDAFKYIISADFVMGLDGLPLMNTQQKGGKTHTLARPPRGFPKHDIYLQPMDQYVMPKNEANTALCVELAMKHGYRVSTQLHKQWGLP